VAALVKAILLDVELAISVYQETSDTVVIEHFGKALACGAACKIDPLSGVIGV
jgi:hypothetical protein